MGICLPRRLVVCFGSRGTYQLACLRNGMPARIMHARFLRRTQHPYFRETKSKEACSDHRCTFHASSGFVWGDGRPRSPSRHAQDLARTLQLLWFTYTAPCNADDTLCHPNFTSCNARDRSRLRSDGYGSWIQCDSTIFHD